MPQTHAYFIGHFMYVLSGNHMATRLVAMKNPK